MRISDWSSDVCSSDLVNQIVHRSNDRLERDVEACVRFRVPIVITSLGAREDLNQAIHAYGGITLHDVLTSQYARTALEKGADGLLADALGSGGPTGTLSPITWIPAIRA